MSSTNLNISLDDALLARLDQEAQRESRTRESLIEDAARWYLERQNCWASLFEHGDRLTREGNLTEQDVEQAIADARRERSGQ